MFNCNGGISGTVSGGRPCNGGLSVVGLVQNGYGVWLTSGGTLQEFASAPPLVCRSSVWLFSDYGAHHYFS